MGDDAAGILDAPAGQMVNEVWAWDAAVVNGEDLNGRLFPSNAAAWVHVDWPDSTRDIANFLVHYLPVDVEATTAFINIGEERGHRTQKPVVVGHSFGACTS